MFIPKIYINIAEPIDVHIDESGIELRCISS